MNNYVICKMENYIKITKHRRFCFSKIVSGTNLACEMFVLTFKTVSFSEPRVARYSLVKSILVSPCITTSPEEPP